VRARNRGALGLIVEEVVDLRNGPIKDRHAKAVVIHIQHQVLAHHRQPDQADVAQFLWHNTPAISYRLLRARGPRHLRVVARCVRGRRLYSIDNRSYAGLRGAARQLRAGETIRLDDERLSRR
jgi:hypothetical protein